MMREGESLGSLRRRSAKQVHRCALRRSVCVSMCVYACLCVSMRVYVCMHNRCTDMPFAPQIPTAGGVPDRFHPRHTPHTTHHIRNSAHRPVVPCVCIHPDVRASEHQRVSRKRRASNLTVCAHKYVHKAAHVRRQSCPMTRHQQGRIQMRLHVLDALGAIETIDTMRTPDAHACRCAFGRHGVGA